MTDRECLLAWRRERRGEALRPIIERHGGIIYSYALRRLGNEAEASDVARSVFLVLARRRKKAAKLDRWLLKLTRLACRKLRRRSFSWVREWFERKPPARELSPLPEGLAVEIIAALEAAGKKRPKEKLARWVLRRLFWRRWLNRFACAFLVVLIAAWIAFIQAQRTGFSWVIAQVIFWSSRNDVQKHAEPVRPWAAQLDAKSISSPAEIFRTTNVWPAHLEFTEAQWKALYPKRIPVLPNFITQEHVILLRNPKAPRSGLVGVMGYAFDWSKANFEFGGIPFNDVGVRIKGNVGALIEPKRPFKVDLNHYVKGQTLAGLDHLTFNNLMWDSSFLRDALAYQLFRDAGVPASRTAFAWVTASIEKKWDRQPLGLFLLLEQVDEKFLAERFGTKKMPLFKPVTYKLFEDLGAEWTSYAPLYDLKTKASDADKRRVIELAHLVSTATDAEFAARLADFLDLDEFAGFLAGQVLLASYDGILTTGQNYYLYIDPRSKKFGFIPWDLDSSWGNFWIASKEELLRASIWHPWSGENRFLERVFAVKEFRKTYRARLEDMLSRLFIPERIQSQIDAIVPFIRGPIAAESKFRLDKFEQEIGAKTVTHSRDETPQGVNQPAFPYKRFIEIRARSVRDQLDGKTQGLTPGPLSDRL